MENENFYLKYLKNYILKQKENELKQNGKSDIEPLNYSNLVEKWYLKLIEKIDNSPPKYYVKSIHIVRNSIQDILNVRYDYCEFNEWVENISINIYISD